MRNIPLPKQSTFVGNKLFEFSGTFIPGIRLLQIPNISVSVRRQYNISQFLYALVMANDWKTLPGLPVVFSFPSSASQTTHSQASAKFQWHIMRDRATRTSEADALDLVRVQHVQEVGHAPARRPATKHVHPSTTRISFSHRTMDTNNFWNNCGKRTT